MDSLKTLKPNPKPIKRFLLKFKSFFKIINDWIVGVAEKSWKGAAIGAAAAMVFHCLIMGKFVKTGISPLVDIIIIILMVGLIFKAGSFVKRLFLIVRNFNPYFVSIVIVTLVIGGFIPGSFFSRPFILFELMCGAIAGFAISRGWKKPLSILLFSIVASANIYLFYFLSADGFDNSTAVNDRYWDQKTPSLHIEDPSTEGSYRVKELFYGSGDDKQRPEYASRVSIKTMPVDATPFFDQTSGFKNYMRKIYWGFNSKNYPINARVWYPDGEGSFPLVLIVHGNHLMNDFSDPGYDYLGRLLASRGFIIASVDENFLNGSWIDDYGQGEVFTRAWLLLKHLENWRKWNEIEGNPFFRKVDMNNIALIGHSRGGAAVATASVINKLNKYHLDARQKFDFNFSIKGIVQIAPNDPYTPQNDIPLKPENVNYLLLQGGYDQDMYWFLGNRVYNRVHYSDGNYHFKAALYIYRANHGQFNTVWGRQDSDIPNSWFLNYKPIMDGKDQRQIAKIYISAFLESSLKGKKEFIPMFKDFRQASKILPREYYLNQFEDSNFKYVADYLEDFDVNTATLKGSSIEGKNLKTWSENALPFRDDWGSSQQTSGVYLGWDKKDTTLKGASQYSIHFPDSTTRSLRIDSSKNLFFFICNNKNDIDTIDFTIELHTKTTSVKKIFSNFMILPPVLKTELTKCNYIYSIGKGKPVERVLQYIELPFSEFIKSNEIFRPSEMTQIRFTFDKTDSGEIFLGKIGIN